VEAWAWLRLSADQGNHEAQSALSQVETRLTPQDVAAAKDLTVKLRKSAQP
jgi:hypothetical protein